VEPSNALALAIALLFILLGFKEP